MARTTAKRPVPAVPARPTVIEAHICEGEERLREVFVQNRFVIGSIASYALDLFKNEMVAIEPVQNMSTGGYQHHKRTTVDASVVRACEGAEKMFAEIARRGWTVPLPPLKDMMHEKSTPGFLGGRGGQG